MQIVQGDGAFNALAFGEPAQGLGEFMSSASSGLSNILSESGRAFMTFSTNLAEKVTRRDRQERRQILAGKATGLWEHDIVRPLKTLDELQQCKSVMRRYMMANQKLRRLYHKQQISGYDDLYVDEEPGLVGDDHYDYRRVMNGVVRFDDPDCDWTATTYFDELHEGDVELDLFQKVDIIESWEEAERYVDAFLNDPTSTSNAMM